MNSSVLIKMIELFIIILVGYGTSKLGVLNVQVKASLSRLILNVAMPCTILASVLTSETLPDATTIFRLLIVSFLTYIILFLLAKLTARVLRLKGTQKGAAEFGIMFSNVGFIGFPVTAAVFGSSAIFYTSVFNMPFNLLCYSVGILMLQNGNDGQKMDRTILMDTVKKALNPGFFSAVIALALALMKFQGPAWIGDTTELIGGITTPGALLIIGMALAEMPVKDMFSNVKAYIFTVISVVVTPLVMYLIFRPFVSADPLLLGVMTIISAMPVATAGTMLCVSYGGDEKFMAQVTFLTTLASVVTIPVFASFLV